MPDFFRGVPWKGPPGSDQFKKWKAAFSWEGAIEADIQERVLPFLAEQGCGKGAFAIVGFCWGAMVAMKAAASGKFKAAAYIHPSSLTLEMAEAASCPQLMLPVVRDSEDVREGGRICAAIKAKKLLYKVQSFQSRHGFVTRGDLSEPEVKQEVS